MFVFFYYFNRVRITTTDRFSAPFDAPFTKRRDEPQDRQPPPEPGDAVRGPAQETRGRMRGQGTVGRRDAVLQDVGEQLQQVHQLDVAAVLQKEVSDVEHITVEWGKSVPERQMGPNPLYYSFLGDA